LRKHSTSVQGLRAIDFAMRTVLIGNVALLVTGEWRIGQALAREEKAPPGPPPSEIRHPELRISTISEKVGNRMMGWRQSRRHRPTIRCGCTRARPRA
jgi:hypothetical protein